VTGGTYRLASFTRYASLGGWHVSVFANPEPSHPTAAGEHMLAYAGDSEVHRISRQGRTPSYSWFPRLDGGLTAALKLARLAKPCLAAAPPSVVIASGPPFASFVAASHVAVHFGVPLVLDYRDEWTQCPFDFVKAARTDLYWEKRCLRQAAAVIFTTDSQLRHQCSMFAFDELKATVIPNGWEPLDQPMPTANEDEDSSQDQRVTIAFVGYLGSHCLPQRFLGTVARLAQERPELRGQWRLQFCGEKSPEAHQELDAFPFQEMIVRLEQAPRPVATAAMRRATALLAINPPAFSRYIPGKLYDYIASGRPVLAYGTGGEIGRLIADLDVGTAVEDGDSAGLLRAIAWCAARTSSESKGRVGIWLTHHTREVLARRMVAVLHRVLGAHTV
jgi:glycosyltransferase involved in cell wall biosynthesis